MCDEDDRSNLAVWLAQDSDGMCNVCRPDLNGYVRSRGPVVAVRMNGLVVRVCEGHWLEMSDAAMSAFGRQAVASGRARVKRRAAGVAPRAGKQKAR